MRHLLTGILLSAIIVACSSEGSVVFEDEFVDELSDFEQEDLCNDVLDGYCLNSGDDAFCDDPCVQDALVCGDAVADSEIDLACGPGDVIVAEVLDCADTGDSLDCGVGAGGCIIDAVEVVCGF